MADTEYLSGRVRNDVVILVDERVWHNISGAARTSQGMYRIRWDVMSRVDERVFEKIRSRIFKLIHDKTRWL